MTASVADHDALEALLAPLLVTDAPPRRRQRSCVLDRALMRLEGLELERQASWARRAVLAALARTAPSASGPHPRRRRGTTPRRSSWQRRALRALALDAADRRAGCFDALRREAVSSLDVPGALPAPIALQVVLRFGVTQASRREVRGLARLAVALDPGPDARALLAAAQLCEGRARLARATWRGLPRDPANPGWRERGVGPRLVPALGALFAEDAGDLPCMRRELAALDGEGAALARFTLAAVGGDARGAGRELENLSNSELPALLGAPLVARVPRWRRLQPARIGVGVRRVLARAEHEKRGALRALCAVLREELA